MKRRFKVGDLVTHSTVYGHWKGIVSETKKGKIHSVLWLVFVPDHSNQTGAEWHEDYDYGVLIEPGVKQYIHPTQTHRVQPL